ncbi:spore germination protein KB [Paenibacillus phyllosphaerae]|uniref:Spore germination protein KB n=1 Tax=Paenibacillus phyllosphaerae TaxID=274593 RepID=A0A7W5AYQ7_9BACL|nr:endospore germination permease [Paenibacillus phyllosphaerae]MBB3110746.1 spore germination protein KB [Paenibacillus phyllosphaerae]
MERGRISAQQLMIMMVLFVLGDTILVLPGSTAMLAGKDAWISGLLTVAAGLGLIWFYAAFQKRFPAMTLVDVSVNLLGRWLGGAVSFFFLFGYLLLLAASMLRVLGDFMTTHVLPNTPVQFIYLLFLVISVKAVRSGLETIARTAEIVFPWVVMLITLLIMFVVPQSRLYHIEPVMAEGIKPILAGMYIFLAYAFMEPVAFYMVMPFVRLRQGKGLRKPLLLGSGMGGLILVVIIFFCLTVFGPVITRESIYPSYLLAKKIELGEFLQRIEVIMAITWLFTLFFKLIISFYGTCLGAAQLFKLKDYRLLTLPLAMILMVLPDLLAPSVIGISEIGQVYPLFDWTFSVGLPLCLLLVQLVRQKMKRSRSSEEQGALPQKGEPR